MRCAHIWPSSSTSNHRAPSAVAINWDLFAIIFYYFIIKCLWKKCARRSWFICLVCIISIAHIYSHASIIIIVPNVCVCVLCVYMQYSAINSDCAFFKWRTFFTANKDFKREMLVIRSRISHGETLRNFIWIMIQKLIL